MVKIFSLAFLLSLIAAFSLQCLSEQMQAPALAPLQDSWQDWAGFSPF